jgi:hypothetical protein
MWEMSIDTILLDDTCLFGILPRLKFVGFLD